jgi:hypothetical protein
MKEVSSVGGWRDVIPFRLGTVDRSRWGRTRSFPVRVAGIGDWAGVEARSPVRRPAETGRDLFDRSREVLVASNSFPQTTSTCSTSRRSILADSHLNCPIE